MDFLLDIPMCAYNHEKYIAQAIEGVVMQKTNFKFRLLIGEDASTDSTRNIVLKYALAYPEIIFPILHDVNLGAAENTRILLSKCTSKYLALCDGDDYWIDPEKLQKQVDFLEANPEYGLVHTGCEYIADKKIRSIQDSDKIRTDYVFENLLCHDFFISTLTVCVHRNYILEWYRILEKDILTRNWEMGDLPLWLEGALHTKFAFLPDITAHYRVVQNSTSHPSDIKKKFDFFQSIFEIKKYFLYRENVSERIVKKVNIHYNRLLLSFAFHLHNRLMGQKAYAFLKENNVSLSHTECLFRIGSKNLINWFMVKVILKFEKLIIRNYLNRISLLKFKKK